MNEDPKTRRLIEQRRRRSQAATNIARLEREAFAEGALAVVTRVESIVLSSDEDGLGRDLAKLVGNVRGEFE
jgi:hypothetical protein